MNINNSQLRFSAIKARFSLSNQKIEHYSLQICEQLKTFFDDKKIIELNEKKLYVAVYFATEKEVQLDSFIDWAFKKKINLCAPRLGKEFGYMDFFQCHQNSSLTNNRLAILEPEGGVENLVSKDKIDCSICPLAAFDYQGHRIGMGGGYYDRYFANQMIKLLGVAFEVQKITPPNQIEKQPHDVVLDFVITEKKVYQP